MGGTADPCADQLIWDHATPKLSVWYTGGAGQPAAVWPGVCVWRGSYPSLSRTKKIPSQEKCTGGGQWEVNRTC